MSTDSKTIILFSGEFDKAQAAFIIANGAAAMGDDVTIFFTFWGLSLLRKPKKPKVEGKKTFLQTMFGMMMPKGPGRVGLSKMNFLGAGAPLMKKAMKAQGAMSLEDLIESAQEQGVRLVGCTNTVDILGFKPEELIDGVEFMGVAGMLAEADKSNMTLFI